MGLAEEARESAEILEPTSSEKLLDAMDNADDGNVENLLLRIEFLEHNPARRMDLIGILNGMGNYEDKIAVACEKGDIKRAHTLLDALNRVYSEHYPRPGVEEELRALLIKYPNIPITEDDIRKTREPTAVTRDSVLKLVPGMAE